MYTYPFEKLEVWKLAKDFVVEIYNITERFPPEEKFGMVSQLRRASLSISSNSRKGRADIQPETRDTFMKWLIAVLWKL